ncbi:MAG: hypothetical protein WCK28_23240, partial [Burkholderiales bacterium]
GVSAAGAAGLDAPIGARAARIRPVDGGAGAHPDQGADEQADMKRAPHDAYQNLNVRYCICLQAPGRARSRACGAKTPALSQTDAPVKRVAWGIENQPSGES